MEPNEIIEALKGQLRPTIDELGAEIVEFTLKRAGNRFILRLLADKEGGITMGECALINRRLEKVIEENSIISERYLLEVSSPGLDRPLKAKRDFERVQGKEIEVWLSSPVEGKDYISAKIKSADEQSVLMEDKDAKEISVSYQSIARARLSINELNNSS